MDNIDAMIETLQEIQRVSSDISDCIKMLQYYDYRKTRHSLPYIPAMFWRNVYEDWREFEEMYRKESEV
ncbi:MAG: hypothetical protein KKD44_28740 [Proteobacteria bacterium]|nr:hypothetical protein [Pseudomonadota bacterium]